MVFLFGNLSSDHSTKRSATEIFRSLYKILPDLLSTICSFLASSFWSPDDFISTTVTNGDLCHSVMNFTSRLVSFPHHFELGSLSSWWVCSIYPSIVILYTFVKSPFKYLCSVEHWQLFQSNLVVEIPHHCNHFCAFYIPPLRDPFPCFLKCID